jgi:uncharacterized protein (UPF0261 family)
MERCKREGYYTHVTQEELGIAEEISRKGFWNDEVAGGVLSASYEDKYRLMVAGLKGISQVVFLGAVDMINFWGPETVPEKFRDRCAYEHSRGLVTLIRATAEELYNLGKIMAERLNMSKGPTVVVFLLRGF